MSDLHPIFQSICNDFIKPVNEELDDTEYQALFDNVFDDCYGMSLDDIDLNVPFIAKKYRPDITRTNIEALTRDVKEAINDNRLVELINSESKEY